MTTQLGVTGGNGLGREIAADLLAIDQTQLSTLEVQDGLARPNGATTVRPQTVEALTHVR